jgi:hypothetical protein
MKSQLIELNEFHKNRFIRETKSKMRKITSNLFELVDLRICLPYQQINLQSNIYVRELKLEDGIFEYLERDLEDNKDESNSIEINKNGRNPAILLNKLTAQDIKVKKLDVIHVVNL